MSPTSKILATSPALRKLFRAGKPAQLKILEKDVVDEIIFRTRNQRNRLMPELMARSGMRVGEVLKLTPTDIEDRKAIIRNPKSGREAEAVYLPQKIADRLRRYIREKEIRPDARIFPLTYAAARLLVKKQGIWSASMSGLMTCAGTLPPMHFDPAHLLKSCQRCCCDIRIYQPRSGTCEKSAMRRPCDGSIICTGN
jgi:integrase